MSTTRSPAVAGQFYAGTVSALNEQIEAAFEHPVGPGSIPQTAAEPGSIKGLIAPHAGYPYSGPVSAHGFKALAESGRPDSVILIGPNHTRFGSPLAISGADTWDTPLGTVPIDDSLRSQLKTQPGITVDNSTHDGEHSLEVQLPFLQYIYEEPVPIVPIVMSQQNEGTIEELVNALEMVQEGLENVVLIASTDLTHYEPADRATRNDAQIREAIQQLDASSIMQATKSGHTMCGAGPTATVLRGAKRMGATDGEILQYATSGDTAGDTDSVVGYVSATVS